ncbi:glycoside hydrolase family 19 protein [Metapseudomonas otitidis]|uniref:glycoside hydrolase family 19 protein n=1 Tax=Metapseudomonas otitidis TaxID=319939 RepID=UPI00366CC735
MSDTTKVKNWSFPFKPKAGKLDPIQHLTAMAQASGGYYPVGANGQWHGGVHFDGKTEAVFDQSQVCCIADGEVIAYRIDTRHPESQYFTSAGASFNAVFSRSFVLVKHHLEAPAKPTAAGTAPEPPPSLTFFSLYMHLLNWEGYTGTNAPNPPAFMGETLYKVKADKATDPVKGLRIRAEPRTGRVVALIPKGSKVRVGDAHPIHSGWYRLLAVVEGRTLPAVAITENMWVFPGEMEQTAEAGIFLVGERANDLEPTLAPEKGLNVRKNGNGRRDDPIVGVLPPGATFRLESSTGTYCKLKEIVDGNDIAPLSPDSAGNIQGFVHLGSLESTRSAPEPNKVYVLPTPHPIKAGELIGHLGHYQNENERSPQRLLHLEVFSCEDVPAFIAKSQAWAAGLPDEQKTLLKVHKNASKLIPHRDDINASNPPKISDAGTTVGVDLIIPQSLLDGLPADSKLQENTPLPGSATPTTTRWWRLDNLLADNNGNPISGWLAEQDLITTRHSPWEWEGYDFIQETGSPVGKATYFYEAWRRLTNEESANYRALVSQEDQGPIKARLYDIIRPGGAKGLLTAQEISPALAKPWHAQSIAQLVTHYESEWHWKPDKWDELDPLMGHLPGIDPNLNWASEKARIKELCWWAALAGKHGISEDGKAWHFQPCQVITSMHTQKEQIITLEMLRAANSSVSEEHYKTILPLLNKYAEQFKVNTRLRIAHLVAQVGHESGFKVTQENLNYSARRMRKIFGCINNQAGYNPETDECITLPRLRPKLWSEESTYAHNPENLGNYVYANKNGNGNEASGDGYRYRGRGIIQLTGKSNYAGYTSIHNANNPSDPQDFTLTPDLIIQNIDYGIESAFAWWQMNRMNEFIDASYSRHGESEIDKHVREISRKVNGGSIGLNERVQLFNKIRELVK